MQNTNGYIGVFGRHMTKFLQEKRKLGYKLNETERLFHSLDKLSLLFDCTIGLSEELVLEFIQKKPHMSQSTYYHKAHTINEFAVYLNKYDVNAYICDKPISSKMYSNFKPYIFTKEEIAGIFEYTDNTNNYRNIMTEQFYRIIFRLLYGCGLRISEALNLKLNDVDLKTGTLLIKNTKNNQDRIIPTNISLSKRIVDYMHSVHKLSDVNEYLFLTYNHMPYKKGTVYAHFRKIIWDKLRLSHNGRAKGGPRLHDLRHTFCVHSLQKMIKQGIPHNTALSLLAVYMGHKNINATTKYLRLTAEVYPEIIRKLNNHFYKIIPESGDVYE